MDQNWSSQIFRPGRASHTHQREHHRISGFRRITPSPPSWRWRESLGLLPGLDSRRSHPLHSRVEQGLLSHLLRLQQGQVSRRKISTKNICFQIIFLTNPNRFFENHNWNFSQNPVKISYTLVWISQNPSLSILILCTRTWNLGLPQVKGM